MLEIVKSAPGEEVFLDEETLIEFRSAHSEYLSIKARIGGLELEKNSAILSATAVENKLSAIEAKIRATYGETTKVDLKSGKVTVK